MTSSMSSGSLPTWEANSHVLPRRQVGDEVVELEHEPDVVPPYSTICL
jgi:hypothetical protein